MISYARPREGGRQFNLGLYREAQERFKQIDYHVDLSHQSVEGPEEFLALYESYAARLGIESLQSKVMSNNLTDLQKKRIKILDGFIKKEHVALDKYAVRTIVEKFYVLSLAPDANLLGRMLERWKFTLSFDQALRQRSVVDMVGNGIEEGLIRTGNLKNTETIKKFRKYRSEYPNIEKSIVNGAFIAFILFESPPILLPAYSFKKARKLPKELVTKILNEGFQAARPHLRKIYHKSVHFNRAYKIASTFYSLSILTYYGYFLLRDFEGVSFLSGIEGANKESLDKLQKETFDAQRIRLEQLENWKQSIQLFEGRNPTIEETEKYWNELLEIPDKDLLVDYSPKD